MAKNLTNLAGKPLVSETAFGGFPTMTPGIVCLAFAVELYIKDLYHVIDKKPPRGHDGHNILALYEGLPEHNRQDIFAHDDISQNSFFTRGSIFSVQKYSRDFTAYDGFLDTIKTISNSFVDWRYSYERGAVNYDISFAVAFIKAIKSTTDQIRKKSKRVTV
jgi:hypothetical protein